MVTVYLAHRLSKTAHRDPACCWLGNRPGHCGPPLELQAAPQAGTAGWWVQALLMIGGQAKLRALRLCSRCGNPQAPLVGVQTSVDPAVVPERPIYGRRRRQRC